MTPLPNNYHMVMFIFYWIQAYLILTLVCTVYILRVSTLLENSLLFYLPMNKKLHEMLANLPCPRLLFHFIVPVVLKYLKM